MHFLYEFLEFQASSLSPVSRGIVFVHVRSSEGLRATFDRAPLFIHAE